MTDLTQQELELVVAANQGERAVGKYLAFALKDEYLVVPDEVSGKNSVYKWNEEKLLWLKLSSLLHFLTDIAKLFHPLVAKLSGRGETELVTKVLACYNDGVKLERLFDYFAVNPVAVNRLDQGSDELPLLGGYKINLRTSEISKRSRYDLWTYEINVTHEPASEQAVADAQTFYQNLTRDEKGQPRPDVLQQLQKLSGYWLTLDLTDNRVYSLVGSYCSGKSELCRQMARVLGQRIAVINPELLSSDPAAGGFDALASLKGKSMICCASAPKDLNSEFIRTLAKRPLVLNKASGKMIINQAKLVVLSNLSLETKGVDDCVQRIALKADFTWPKPEEKYANDQLLSRLNTQDGMNGLFQFWLEGTMFESGL